MEYKFITTTWKTSAALEKTIKEHEIEGWAVMALGEVFGGNVLIMGKDGQYYEHEAVQVLFKTREKLEKIVAEKTAEGWQVCSLGECFGSILMIFRRQKA